MSLPEISTDRDWLEAYLDNGLLPAEREKLEKRLCLEDDLADLLVSIVNHEAVIQEWAALQETSSWSFHMPRRFSVRPSLLPSAKFLAVGLLLFTVTAVFWIKIYHLAAPLFNKAPSTIVVTPTTPTAKNVAIVKTISEGELRSQDILFVVNDHLKTGEQYHLEKGLLGIEMDSGAEIIIAGPTTFQLLDSNKLRLLHGTITANVPQQAIGFTVNTPTMKVVDLGTQFGVHVNRKGTSEIHVFKGIVDCFVVKGREIDLSPQRLTAGKSLKRQAGGELVQSDTKSEELFAKGLQQQAGIQEVSGDVKFIPTMPVSLAGGEFTSDKYIQVFSEQQDFVLPEDIHCFVIGENQTNQKQLKRGIIKKGTKVNVYYFHFDDNRLGHPEYSINTESLVLKGTIYFNGKVLGYLHTNSQLLQTDISLGVPGTQYLNKDHKNKDRAAEDKIKVLSERHALHLDWKLGRNNIIGGIDAIRVIVVEEEIK